MRQERKGSWKELHDPIRRGDSQSLTRAIRSLRVTVKSSGVGSERRSNSEDSMEK